MTGHTTKTEKPWTKAAEHHINQTGAYDINPEEIADKVIEAISDPPSRDVVEGYIRDRMWYRRGV